MTRSVKTTAREGRIVILHDVPAPYRLRAFNRLGELARGRLTLLFHTTAGMQDKWSVPASELTCDWRFLATEHGWRHPWQTVKAIVKTATTLWRIRPSVVICSGYASWPGWICLPICRLMGSRFVTWVSATERDVRPNSRLRRFLKSRFVRAADGVAVVGKASTRYMQSLGVSSDRLFLIPNGFDISFFEEEAAKVRSSNAKAGDGYPSRMLLCSGRLVSSKGVFVLLEAFRRVAAKQKDVGLLFVGSGPERERMEAVCKEAGLTSVFFAGAQPYEKLPYYYGIADIVVLPTFSDTWGMVVTEAFACGVPAVVSHVAGVCDDLVEDGRTGFAVNPGDATELADRILQLLEDDDMRRMMSDNCKRAVSGYTVEACANGLLQAADGVHPSVPLRQASIADPV